MIPYPLDSQAHLVDLVAAFDLFGEESRDRVLVRFFSLGLPFASLFDRLLLFLVLLTVFANVDEASGSF